MMRVGALIVTVLLLAPADAAAQRISTWHAPASSAAVDSVGFDRNDAGVGEQAAWGAVVGAVAGLAGSAHAPEPDPSDPLRLRTAEAWDASIFERMDFTPVGALSAGIAAAAAEWARGRIDH